MSQASEQAGNSEIRFSHPVTLQQHLPQSGNIHRFAQEVIHTRRPARILIALEDIGCHRDQTWPSSDLKFLDDPP